MGTAGYMAPEQVRGEPADARSDIFSLGAILYEMLTGRRAFRGGSSIETLNAVLKEDPPELAAAGRTFVPGLARIVKQCLHKRPGERFSSARDLALALLAISESPVPGPPPGGNGLGGKARAADRPRRSSHPGPCPRSVRLAVAERDQRACARSPSCPCRTSRGMRRRSTSPTA